MEKVFGQRFIGHKLSHKQPLVTFAATAEQISHPLTPQLTNGPRFLLHTQREDITKIVKKKKRENYETKVLEIRTRNCRASGHAILVKRLTAIFFWFSSFPLQTTLGAFSPCSETIYSTAKPEVADLSWSNVYSRKAGTSVTSLLSPFSAINQIIIV